jgi:hypothetical protein
MAGASVNYTSSGLPKIDEAEIVWLEDPRLYRYIRETVVRTPDRDSRVSGHGHCLVAYATLEQTAPPEPDTGTFSRRVWYVLQEEAGGHDLYGGHGAPAEGVDPLSIKAGHPSMNPPDAKPTDGASER